LNFEVVVYLAIYARRQAKPQWKFGGAANDKCTCTTEK